MEHARPKISNNLRRVGWVFWVFGLTCSPLSTAKWEFLLLLFFFFFFGSEVFKTPAQVCATFASVY